jgi:hypothetical protein
MRANLDTIAVFSFPGPTAGRVHPLPPRIGGSVGCPVQSPLSVKHFSTHPPSIFMSFCVPFLIPETESKPNVGFTLLKLRVCSAQTQTKIGLLEEIPRSGVQIPCLS